MSTQTTRRQVLRQLIKDLAHGSREEFGKRYGIDDGYLSGLVDNRPISEKTARNLEEKVGLPSGYFGNSTHALQTPIELLGRLQQAADEGAEAREKYIELPVLAEGPVTASTGLQAPVTFTGKKVHFPLRILTEAGVDEQHAAIAVVSSSAMAPMIRDGATIGIDLADPATRDSRTLIDGKVYVVDHAGQLRVKYLFRTPAGGLRMHSLNSAVHPDEVYAFRQVAKDIKILGRVFWVSMLL